MCLLKKVLFFLNKVYLWISLADSETRFQVLLYVYMEDECKHLLQSVFAFYLPD